jgi:hypothetical protein
MFIIGSERGVEKEGKRILFPFFSARPSSFLHRFHRKFPAMTKLKLKDTVSSVARS